MRATGRTTRMLMDAIQQAKNGHDVCVVAANLEHAGILRQMYCDMVPEEDVTLVKFASVAMIENFDWDTLRIKGEPNSKILLDHYTVEAKFEKLLEMYHRYDVDRHEWIATIKEK